MFSRQLLAVIVCFDIRKILFFSHIMQLFLVERGKKPYTCYTLHADKHSSYLVNQVVHLTLKEAEYSFCKQ